MPIERTNFDAISEADILELISAGVPESLTIEYKRDGYGKTDEQKREALKDITAFANSHGGHLIIGIDEGEAVPVEASGLAIAEADELRERLEALMRDGVEPRLLGVRTKLVELTGGRRALVLRIPKSWNPPHRVSAQRSNRFWVRNSSGVHEASVEELRSLFTLASNTQERMRDFILRRTEVIRRQQGPVILVGRGTLIAHILPLAAFGQPNPIAPESVFKLQHKFRPIGDFGGFSPGYNLDGFINRSGGDQCKSFVQVFRNGIVEAARTDIMGDYNQHAILYPDFAGQQLVDAIPLFFDALKALDVPPPYVVSVSYLGIGGSHLGLRGYDRYIERVTPFPNTEPLLLPEIVFDDAPADNQELAKAMRPAFDAIWNAAGFAKCTQYDDQGNWQHER